MSEFIDHVREVFSPVGKIHARRMFGGYGIYCGGVMLALVEDDVLYLKADGDSERAFSERGLQQFEYARKGKTVRLSYFEAPAEMFDDEQEAAAWASLAYQAALRARSRMNASGRRAGGAAAPGAGGE